MDPFLSFLFFFQTYKTHKYVGNDVRFHYKGLGLVIQYVGKDKTIQVVDEYDRQILVLLLVCAYNFLNSIQINEKALSSTSQTIESTSMLWSLGNQWGHGLVNCQRTIDPF